MINLFYLLIVVIVRCFLVLPLGEVREPASMLNALKQAVKANDAATQKLILKVDNIYSHFDRELFTIDIAVGLMAITLAIVFGFTAYHQWRLNRSARDAAIKYFKKELQAQKEIHVKDMQQIFDDTKARYEKLYHKNTELITVQEVILYSKKKYLVSHFDDFYEAVTRLLAYPGPNAKTAFKVAQQGIVKIKPNEIVTDNDISDILSYCAQGIEASNNLKNNIQV